MKRWIIGWTVGLTLLVVSLLSAQGIQRAATSVAFLLFNGYTFAQLGSDSNGVVRFCTDCTIASPCASGGTGALAKRLNATWVCN